MANHQELQGIIESLLLMDEDCRDNVPYLYIKVVKELGESYQTSYSMLLSVNYSSVHRIKNKLQKRNIELRGRDYESNQRKRNKVRMQYSPTYWDKLRSWWGR